MHPLLLFTFLFIPGFALNTHPGLRMLDLHRIEDPLLNGLLPTESRKKMINFLNSNDLESNTNYLSENSPNGCKISEFHTIMKNGKTGEPVPCGYVIRTFEHKRYGPEDSANSVYDDSIPEKKMFLKKDLYLNKAKNMFKAPDLGLNELQTLNKHGINLLHDTGSNFPNLNLMSHPKFNPTEITDKQEKSNSFPNKEKGKWQFIKYPKKYVTQNKNNYSGDKISGNKNSFNKKTLNIKVGTLNQFDVAPQIKEKTNRPTQKQNSHLFLQSFGGQNKNFYKEKSSTIDQTSEKPFLDYSKKISKNNFDAKFKLSHENEVEKTYQVNMNIEPIYQDHLKEEQSFDSKNDFFHDITGDDKTVLNPGKAHTSSTSNFGHGSHSSISKREAKGYEYLSDEKVDPARRNFVNYGENLRSSLADNEIPTDEFAKENKYQDYFHWYYLKPLKEKLMKEYREKKLKNNQSNTYSNTLEVVNDDPVKENKNNPSSTTEEETVDKNFKESNNKENLVSNESSQNVDAFESSFDESREQLETNKASIGLDHTFYGNSYKLTKPNIHLTSENYPETEKEELLFPAQDEVVNLTDIKFLDSKTDNLSTCPHLLELLFWNKVKNDAMHFRRTMLNFKGLLI